MTAFISFLFFVSFFHLVSSNQQGTTHDQHRVLDENSGFVLNIGALIASINSSIPSTNAFDATLSQLHNVYHEGNLCPFKNKVLTKMQANKPIEIVIMGGSVTHGADLKDRLGERWSAHFDKIMNSGWYKNKINVNNIGTPACNIDVWLHRINDLRDADLVIVDLSVNDQGFDLPSLPLYYHTLISLIESIPTTYHNNPKLQSPAILFNYAFRTAKYDKGDTNHHCPKPTEQGMCCNGYVYCKRWWDMQDYTALTLDKHRIPYISFRDLYWPVYDKPPDNLPIIWNGMSHPDKNAHYVFAKSMAYAVMMQIKSSRNHVKSAQCNKQMVSNAVKTGESVVFKYISNYNNNGSSSSSSVIKPICTAYNTYMMATNTAESKGSFVLTPESVASTSTSTSTSAPTSPWRFYNDSKSKFGWIYESTQDAITQQCDGKNWCDDAYEKNKISLKLSLTSPSSVKNQDSKNTNRNTSTPIIQLTYLKTYGEQMGAIVGWFNSQREVNFTLNSWWDHKYSISRVVTISFAELTHVSDLMKGDSIVLKNSDLLTKSRGKQQQQHKVVGVQSSASSTSVGSASAGDDGTDVLHISIAPFHTKNVKFKLLGITTC